MKIEPFKLERFFARYEFSAPYLLCCSDCEGLSLKELLDIADDESLLLWNGLTLGYTESQGHPLLREEVSKLYDTIGPEEVLILTPEEGIFIAMNVLLEKGDHVVAAFPGYQSLYSIAQSIGCEVSAWTPKQEKGWLFDIDDLENLVRENTKVIVINFPHNPTGAVMDMSGLERIIGIAEKRNILLFSDEMYRFLEYDKASRTSSACDIYDNAISLFGMSKSYALAGLRIGWLAAKNTRLLGQLAAFKDYTTICSSAPDEILAIMALRAGDRILKKNLEMIAGNLKLLDKFFADHPGLFRWNRPQAGPIAFPELKSGTDVSDFCSDLIEKKGVLLLPAGEYGFEGNYFRIGFARRNMPESLEKLREYVREKFY